MKTNQRKLTLCKGWTPTCDSNGFPVVRLKGKWLTTYGFSPGDQVVISNPEPRTLIMRVSKLANEVNRERIEKKANAMMKAASQFIKL